MKITNLAGAVVAVSAVTLTSTPANADPVDVHGTHDVTGYGPNGERIRYKTTVNKELADKTDTPELPKLRHTQRSPELWLLGSAMYWRSSGTLSERKSLSMAWFCRVRAERSIWARTAMLPHLNSAEVLGDGPMAASSSNLVTTGSPIHASHRLSRARTPEAALSLSGRRQPRLDTIELTRAFARQDMELYNESDIAEEIRKALAELSGDNPSPKVTAQKGSVFVNERKVKKPERLLAFLNNQKSQGVAKDKALLLAEEFGYFN